MKKNYKIFLAILLTVLIAFSVAWGCERGKITTTTTETTTNKVKKDDSSSKKSKKENKNDSKKGSKEKSENKKDDNNKNEDSDKENKQNISNVKKNNEDSSQKENAKNNDDSNDSSNNTSDVETKKEESPEVVESKQEEDTFTMIIGKDIKGYTGKSPQQVKELTLKVEDGKNAMTYLRENTVMQENGGFIFEIDGIHNFYPIPENQKTPEQKANGILGIDWFIYLNDKKTPVGANDVYVKKGDILLFDFHEWDKREFSPPED
ncbi:hypothetical protein UT300019_03830 [Clostridium sp. CTA-19]